MAEVIKRQKALSVSPLKASQPVGATLAVLGLDRAMPLLHGSQGCTAFAKVFFVRHFREPIPLQTTAIDQVAAIMGSEDNLIEGLKTVCEKNKPTVIGLLTTGVVEAQGVDVQWILNAFRQQYPEFQNVRIVAANTPDFDGCFETGFAKAVGAMLDTWTPPADTAKTQPGRRPRQINVLTSAMLTPGDLEALKDIIGYFGLEPVMIPDISDSLDGHLGTEDYSPITTGGAPVTAFDTLGDAAATLVIGASMFTAADLLHERTGVPDHRFEHVMGLAATDKLLMTLAKIADCPVPARLERQRAQLQDAMLDTHFMLSQARIAIAADADMLNAFSHLLNEIGAEVVAAVTPSRAAVLARIPLAQVQIGDLEDLETSARQQQAELVIGNSHAAESAERLELPLVRAGFPLYDRVGTYQRTWIGYRGARQTLFDLANILLEQKAHEIEPHHSFYSQKSDQRQEASDHELAAASTHSERRR